MRNFIRITYVVAFIGAAILVGIFWGSTAQETPATQKKNVKLEQRLAELPVVDFTDTDSAESEPGRAARNKRHNSPVSQEGARRPKLNEHMEPVLLDLPISHQPAEPAFPVSDLIVVGTIEAAKAYLSSDRTGVYSEVSVSIEDLLKTNPQYGLKTRGTVVAERSGGAVRFASGKILRRGSFARNIPTKGHRYLLFLNQTGDGGFSIVTGYELTGNGVLPLDGGAEGKGFAEFQNYESFRNATEASLLEAVRTAINGRGVGGPR